MDIEKEFITRIWRGKAYGEKPTPWVMAAIGTKGWIWFSISYN